MQRSSSRARPAELGDACKKNSTKMGSIPALRYSAERDPKYERCVERSEGTEVPALRNSADGDSERLTKYQRCANAPREAQGDSRSTSAALQR